MQRWRNISIDFMVDLPSSNGFTNIMVVVDYLMKMRYMVPINSINAVLVAECFIKYVFKLHRLPNSIVSNYGSQFVLDFW
jgi:phage gp36-like protein